MVRALGVLLVCLISACSDGISDQRTYVLTTGTTGGTFYPVGVALSTLVSAKGEQGFSLTAISSAGSMENIKLLRDNQAQFGLILGTFAAWAYEGDGPISAPQPHLRSISAMWPNVEHFVLRSDLVIDGTISDLGKLEGERYSIGMRNSGAEHTGLYILDALGIDYTEDLSIAYLGYGPSTNALQDGNIVGMNVPAGPTSNGHSSCLRTARRAHDHPRVFRSGNDSHQSTIFHCGISMNCQPGTYPRQEKPVTTAYSSNVFVVRDDVSEEVVYDMTKLLWDNLATLQEIHSATKSMAIEAALKGIPVPLHKGALRYYKEQGSGNP